MIHIPRLTRFLAVTALLYVVVFFMMRMGFWLAFRSPGDSLPLSTLLQSFYLGFKFDLRLALLIILPILLTGLARPTTLRKMLKIWGIYLLVIAGIASLYFLIKGYPGTGYLIGKWQRIVPFLIIPPVLVALSYLNPIRSIYWRRFWLSYLSIATITVLLFYVFDFGHYAYLGIRIDSTVMRFVENPLISGQMVWESYPVIWITLGVSAAALLLIRTLVIMMQRLTFSEYLPLPRPKEIALLSVTMVIVLGGIYGKLSSYPLRWSDAFFGTHAFASAVALNPVLYFSDTYMNRGMPYNRKRVENAYATMANYLGATPVDSKHLNYQRPVSGNGPLTEKPNVIVVILESFASYKSGLSGNPLKTTPNFDAIANDGIYFDNFFTPHTCTARSVFDFTTGIPDVQLGDTSSRNPTIVNQHVLINAFEDYEKYYFLGGSASWRNIRALLANNIPGLNIYEEGNYQSPRIDVWGISDIDLFKEANQVIKGEEKPFFAIIQTSGNHRPYTIPENNESFESHTPDIDVTRYGFESVEEYNSYRFMDHSIGHFIKLAKQEGYFDNTLFVFFGDHGINDYAGDHSPKHDTQLLLGSYRVPFVLYAPRLLDGGRVEHKPASEVDVMTTLANLTGHAHTNTTFGRDLLDERYDEKRFAFTIHHSSIPNIGLVGDEYYFRMRANGSDKNLFKLNTDNPRENFVEKMPELAAEMEQMASGYYETARYIMNNNAPLKGGDNKQ